MPLQGYFDDSNYVPDGARKPELLIYAGYIADQSGWQQLDVAWRSCLKEEPRIRYFKMSEAMSGEGEFSRIPEPIRHYKINQFYKIIAEFTLAATLSVIVIEDFEEVMRPEHGIPEALCNPHFFSYYGIVQNVGAAIKLLSLPGPVTLTFDEGNPASKAIGEAWKSFRDFGPVPRSSLAGAPLFASDKDCPPLQAADYLAWVLTRKAGRQFESKKSPTYPWEKGISPKSVVPNVWNKENLLAYRIRSEARRRELLNNAK